MYLPSSLRSIPTTGVVSKLEKARNGCKKAPFLFRAVVHAYRACIKFMCSTSDPCLYCRRNKYTTTLIALHVGYLLLSGGTLAALTSLTFDSILRFEVKIIVSPTMSLGLQISPGEQVKNLHPTQSIYV